MAGSNYDSDDARGLSPPLKKQTPDYNIHESPPPFLPSQSNSPESNSGPAGREGKRPHRRRKNPNSKIGTSQILMSLDPNRPGLVDRIVNGPFRSTSSSSSSPSSEILSEGELATTQVKSEAEDTPMAVAAAQGALQLWREEQGKVSSPPPGILKREHIQHDPKHISPRSLNGMNRRLSSEGPSHKVLPPFPDLFSVNSRSPATSPELQQFKIQPSHAPATQTLPALRSPPRATNVTSAPETNLPSLKATLPEELGDSRTRDQSFPPNGASPLYSQRSPPPQSRGPVEPSIRPPPLPSGHPYLNLSQSNSKDIASLSSTPQSQHSPWHPAMMPERSLTGSSCDTVSQLADTPSAGYPTPCDKNEPPTPTNSSSAGSFRCTYAGCTAPPFQTQYLLNSHTNVHSQDRPYFCPVSGCPRSEGGKGFKRKNEMIRHGLVHDSPGYVCPFCHDQQHRYPRPDNLQRHVRVHHVDRNKDDPLLRRVLSRRPESVRRGRKRRS